MTEEERCPGRSFNLNFHSVPYYGKHPVVQSHYVSSRSRRQPSMLVFLAHDPDGNAFCYSNVDIRKREKAPVELSKRSFRQVYVLDLGHVELTILQTNQRSSPAALITRYAQRMLIENAISIAMRFFSMDALSSSVGMKVDFDLALLVIASGLYRLLARRMRGYANKQARQIFRDIIDMPAEVRITKNEVRVRFHRRSHLPIAPPQVYLKIL